MQGPRFRWYLNMLLGSSTLKKLCIFALRILQRTWVNHVKSKNHVLYKQAHMSGVE